MIHLVTHRQALVDCLHWIRSGDRIVLMGSAVGGYWQCHRQLPNGVTLTVFSEDAALFALETAQCIEASDLINWLEHTPCRTWS